MSLRTHTHTCLKREKVTLHYHGTGPYADTYEIINYLIERHGLARPSTV
jgi:hypothetical protein